MPDNFFESHSVTMTVSPRRYFLTLTSMHLGMGDCVRLDQHWEQDAVNWKTWAIRQQEVQEQGASSFSESEIAALPKHWVSL